MSLNKITEFKTKKGRVVGIIAPTMELLPQLIEFYKRLTEEDAMINRYENLKLDEEKRKLESKIQEIEAGNAVAIWAILDKKIVGTCNISRLGGRSRHVGKLGVMIDRDFRREGIGQFLMEHTLNNVGKIDIKIAILDSFVNNEPALSLYRKVGFREYGRLPKALLWRGKYYDAINMYKEIQ